MCKLAVAFLLFIASAAPNRAQDNQSDPWVSIRFLVGEWAGTASGEPGTGTVSRRYEFVLGNRFIHERNTSTYPPQAKNKAGEVHQHWSILSYDRNRKNIIFRQFHQEGFVILYALNSILSTPSKLVFDSEQTENVNKSWKARETYEVISSNEFTETFELAQPDKPFEIYSRNHFKRVRQ
jgi:hypothetical protein